jgi:hypothetical protein
LATIGFYEGHQLSADFAIQALHVNFWILPTEMSASALLEAAKLKRMHRCFVDVGVRFTAGPSGPPPHLDFLPPAKWTKSRSFFDLSKKVTDPNVSDLIFGSNVKITGSTVSYSQSDDVITEAVLAVDQLQNLGDGRYRAVFAGRGSHGVGDSYYFRLRYECGDISRIFRSKGWGFAKRGWIFDLRVNDIRETVELPEALSAERMLPIKRCYIFLIAPSSYVPALHSPELKYTRLLELKVWKKYLDTCRNVGKNARSSIYYWREEKTPATNAKPMRTYMHLHREFGLVIFAVYGLGIIALPWISELLRYFWSLVWPLAMPMIF